MPHKSDLGLMTTLRSCTARETVHSLVAPRAKADVSLDVLRGEFEVNSGTSRLWLEYGPCTASTLVARTSRKGFRSTHGSCSSATLAFLRS
jgi:phage tail tube protein FII